MIALSQLVELESRLGVSFRDKAILNVALTHSSYLNENPGEAAESNERLEFLGDAMIGSAVGEELYCRRPGWTEGQLTQARAALVKGATLSRVARGLRLGDYLRMGAGELAGGGSQRSGNLEAALEAVAGALFLDQGYDATRKFVVRVLCPEIDDLDAVHLQNPKSTLQEAVQANGLAPPTYEIVNATGADHAPSFTVEVSVDGEVVGRGDGSRKADAEQRAAAEALDKLDQS